MMQNLWNIFEKKLRKCVFFSKDLPLSQNWNYLKKTLSHHTGGVMMTRSVLLGKHVNRQPILIPSANYALEYGHNWGWICRPSFRQVTASSWFTPSCTPSTSAFQKHQQQNWSISQGHLVQRNFSFGWRQRAGHFCQCFMSGNALGIGFSQNKCSSALSCLGPALILGMRCSLHITLHVKHLKKIL